MDNKKDVQNEASDNSSENKSLSTFVFNGDVGYAFIYKKTERIATAIYLISNFFSDNEPLKWSMRGACAELLSDILSVITIAGSDYALSSVKKGIAHISSLVDIAHAAGLVSPMNRSILTQEFDVLMKAVESKESPILAGLNTTALKQSFFNVGNIEKQVIEKNVLEEKNNFHTSSTRTQFPIKDNSYKTEKRVETGVSVPGRITSIMKGSRDVSFKQTSHPSQPNVKLGGVVEEKKSRRMTIILDLLKKKTKVNIKDVADVITDCSEKTLQRELLALVSEGVLKKEGERRWSTYSLA